MAKTSGGAAGADLDHAWEEPWPGAPDTAPQGRCRFVVSPPRNFLYPALLLLLAEEPRHGYLLCDALPSLGLGKMDRPSVYRALAELEGDGLVRSWDAAPTAGSTRHVHAVTPEGEQALEAWMSIVSRERNSLDLVLQRYWYTNARRLDAMGVEAVLTSQSAQVVTIATTGIQNDVVRRRAGDLRDATEQRFGHAPVMQPAARCDGRPRISRLL